MRHRLQWQPLGRDEGTPVGLEAGRTRLANTSADLWSAQDRRVVGAMLQQRIAAERGDADPGRHAGDGDGSLVDQLARSTTAAGIASVSHACRNVRQDFTHLHHSVTNDEVSGGVSDGFAEFEDRVATPGKLFREALDVRVNADAEQRVVGLPCAGLPCAGFGRAYNVYALN